MVNKIKVNNIFKILSSLNPRPTTELVYHNDFELLVAVVLSARTTDKSVNKATYELFKIANTPKKIIALGEKKLENYIRNIGFYRIKAKNVISLSLQLINAYDSKVPNNYNDLIKLKGVGVKTANVVLNTLFKVPVIAVDTHVYRVSTRLGLAQGDIKNVASILNNIVPTKYKMNAHHLLILHGRYTCLSRKPKCFVCDINKYCDYYEKML